MEKAFWICVNINERYNSSQFFDDIKNELINILGNDFKDVCYVGNYVEKDVFCNALGNYFFVKVSNVHNYILQLKKCKYIKNILNSYDDISYVDEKEIDIVKKDWSDKNKSKDQKIFFGDIVEIKKGMYEKLNGIVVDFHDDDNVTVLFKLYTNSKFAKLSKNNIVVKNNLFNFVRIPYE